MKKITTLLFALAFLVLAAVPARANYEKFDVDAKVREMKQKLILTDDQEGQVKTILNDFQDQVEQAHKDKMDKLNAVLTDDQQDKLDELKKEWKKEKK